MTMPVLRIEVEVFSLLVAEAQRLEVSVKDLVSLIVLEYFSEEGEIEEEGKEDVIEESDED